MDITKKITWVFFPFALLQAIFATRLHLNLYIALFIYVGGKNKYFYEIVINIAPEPFTLFKFAPLLVPPSKTHGNQFMSAISIYPFSIELPIDIQNVAWACVRQWIAMYSMGFDTFGIHQHQLEYTPTRKSRRVGDTKMAQWDI